MALTDIRILLQYPVKLKHISLTISISWSCEEVASILKIYQSCLRFWFFLKGCPFINLTFYIILPAFWYLCIWSGFFIIVLLASCLGLCKVLLKRHSMWILKYSNTDIDYINHVKCHYFLCIKNNANLQPAFILRMNRLNALPRGFGSLPALEVLDLTYNNLNEKSLPGNFFYLSKK